MRLRQNCLNLNVESEIEIRIICVQVKTKTAIIKTKTKAGDTIKDETSMFYSKLIRGAIKKKLPNFGHRPNMGGGQCRSQTFIEKRYGHVFRGEGGSKGLIQSSFL